jgi:hypothetical protein
MDRHITEIQQLYNSIERLFESLDNFPEINKSVLKSKIKIEYELHDPTGRMLIDASGKKVKVYSDTWPAELSSNVKLTMPSNVCHQYWMGKINFMFASFNGEIKTEGDIDTLLKVLPLAEALFKVYSDDQRKGNKA